MAFKWLKKDKSESPENAADTRLAQPEETAENADAAPDTGTPALSTSEQPLREKKGLFSRLKNGLRKTRDILTTDIDELFLGHRRLDDDMLEQLEELLMTSDMGVQTTMDIVETVGRRGGDITDPDSLKRVLKDEIKQLMTSATADTDTAPPTPPHVIMVVGVNGTGKTTTIGKLAAKNTAAGKKVLVAAADTFRAAAIEQLGIWAERAGAEIVRHQENADPAAVAYDGVSAAQARGADVVLIDTAGRLHTKVNLMEELKKIKRTIGKVMPDAPHEVLLVLDATTGQNAISQARLFHEAIGVTGIALTKLDGTAKGGIVVSICSELGIPLRYIGVGEQIDDLQKFDVDAFVEALL